MKLDFSIYIKNHTNPVQLADIPVLRQAFAVAAILILIGIAGYLYVHPLFILLPLMVSGGLLVSAVLGACPMVAFLQLLPGNKK